MNAYLIAKSLLKQCGVTIEFETPQFLGVINKHGVRERFENTELAIIEYIFAD
jgi:hypothetical protein